ncbi:hypothetical protein UFOVP361_8 [uncultured Caudovirales phage]|uniref:Uncharacterized protein n=1 Tax=uncultured Caudovirales phage TaxID=2100421 RepID=A0A6J7X1D4_9CAUD|nr:hypothetical protein UFOVP361_8 [uncultured Caudovirales phage]
MNDLAKEQAKLYLERSIATLEKILGVDAMSLETIPVNPSSAVYDSYFCLLHEVAAYRKLLSNDK